MVVQGLYSVITLGVISECYSDSGASNGKEKGSKMEAELFSWFVRS